MTTEIEKQIDQSVRYALRELVNPIFEPLKKMTDDPASQSIAFQNMADACAPQTHRLALSRLCEKIEYLVDGSVSGSLSDTLKEDINRFSDTLNSLRKASSDYANFLKPYGGIGGLLRLAMETGMQPWNILTGLVGKHPYQIVRGEFQIPIDAALEEFSDTLPALILALESAISKHTGKNFSFREVYSHVESRPAKQAST